MKKISTILVIALSFMMMPVVLAAPIKWTGAGTYTYERDSTVRGKTFSGTTYAFKLKAETDLGKGWGLYARLGSEYTTQPLLVDYNMDAYGENQKSVIDFDQVGFTYTRGDMVYKLGWQEVAVGETAILYSKGYSNLGKRKFVDGITASGTVGVIDLDVVAVQEDNVGTQDNRLYALHTGYDVTDSLNWGLTLAQYQDRVSGNTNHWAVDGTYKFGKASVVAEYTKSSSSSDNKAYAASLNYNMDAKTTLALTYFKIGTNADIGKTGCFDNDQQGIAYEVTYRMNTKDKINIVYKDEKSISFGNSTNKIVTSFEHNF